jgi:hypothetical protein
MPEYKPWLGISIWIFGSAVAVLLAIQEIISRNEASLLVWVFFVIPILWSCNDGGD